ncbi:MAG: class I SAM-dependent methyltransferase [Gemmatimonadota bacterium]|nr:MAG: class I SAM-dependent methyltransferase [Gemmatimonadota bacterium]
MPLRLTSTTLLAILQPWTEVAEPIYRRVAQLADAEAGQETLWIGCGAGRSVLWWCEKFKTLTEGVDPEPEAIEAADDAARRGGFTKLTTFQVADPTDLPHEDQVFDTIVVHMLHLPAPDGKAVLQEAGRVARPMATVIAIVPSWLQTPSAKEAAVVTRLGIRPQLAVEWKSFFRDAGLVELSVEEPVGDGRWVLQNTLSLIVRGWRAAGWSGMRAVLGREIRTLRRLARKRVLGLLVIKGTRWPHG